MKNHFKKFPKIELNIEIQYLAKYDQVLNFNFNFKHGAQFLVSWTWTHTLYLTQVESTLFTLPSLLGYDF